MKTIAFIVTTLDSGGIENYLLRFLQFSTLKFRPIVICKSGRIGELEEKYRKISDIEIYPIAVGYVNLQSLFKVRKILKKNQVTAICDFTGNFSGNVLVLAWLISIPVRIAFYRGAAIRFKPTRIKLIYNSLMKALVSSFSTKILSNSVAALDYFYPKRNRHSKKFRVIYNGVDSSKFMNKYTKQEVRECLNVPKHAFLVGHLGRNDISKNIKLIGEVAKTLCHKYEDIYFILCGKGTKEFQEEFSAKLPSLSGRVIGLGYREDVDKVLQMYDVFIFPSIIEGQPNALIEAMITGLPIIASNITPIVETVPENMKENLIHPDDIKGFVEQVEKCYINERYRDKLIHKEWAVRQFNPEVLFNEFLSEL